MWAIGDENGTVYVYSTKGELLAQLQSDVSVNALAWSSDGQILAGGNSLWRWNGETFEHRGGHFNGRTALAWSPNDQLLAASFSNSQQVRMVSRQGDLIAVLEEEAICMAWSPNGHTMATGASNGMIYLWDTSSLKQAGVNRIG
jgi:WD40 repeat protein